MKDSKAIIPLGRIEERILLVRGQRVMIDADLADLYGTSTRALNQAVKRNRDRFPEDFMFQMTEEEKREVITICDHLVKHKFSPTPPYAFTEHGTIMLASVLNTPRAISVSVFGVRAFVKLRELLGTHKKLAKKLDELERKVAHYDEAIRSIVTAIRELMQPVAPRKLKIGFKAYNRD